MVVEPIPATTDVHCSSRTSGCFVDGQADTQVSERSYKSHNGSYIQARDDAYRPILDVPLMLEPDATRF
jgi:hypothetical protein